MKNLGGNRGDSKNCKRCDMDNIIRLVDDSQELYRRSDEDYLKHVLGLNYEFRRNVITGRYDFRKYNILPSEREKWQSLNDAEFNSLWSFMRTHQDFKRITETDLRRVIQSDFSNS